MMILSGALLTVENNIKTIIPATGLELNANKCESIMDDFKQIDIVLTFKNFIRVNKDPTWSTSHQRCGKKHGDSAQDR